jgi:AraC family transcriptional regulator of adaptative response/methylated-DNA-[protein]-cysteine methyltransferase
VTTTGIYCKPSCPARRPRRTNVRFFSDHEAARAAGFRPCRRCHPDGDDPLDEVVRRAQAYLHDHLDDGVTLEDLGREVGMSPTHLQRTFKVRIGMSPKEYVRAVRTKRLKSALREGDSTVTRTTFEAGFGSASAAYAAADAYLGMTPATYGAGGRGAHIRYAVVPCQLGHLLAAVTTRGVCAVTLGNPPGALERALRTEFSIADGIGARADFLDGLGVGELLGERRSRPQASPRPRAAKSPGQVRVPADSARTSSGP